ncbi:MAG TPA: tetratricopeptide repeat protein, partial [Bacteroidia bacterium]
MFECRRLYVLICICVLSFIITPAICQDKEKVDRYLKVVEQGKQDTNLVYAYNEIATELLGSDDQKAKEYALKGLTLSKKLNHKHLESWSYNLLGLSYDYLARPDSALLSYQQSLAIKEKLNDIDGIGATYLNIGVLYFYQNDFNNAIVYYNKSLDQYTKSKNERRIAGIFNNLGAIYRQQKKYKEAIEVFDKAYALKIKLQDTSGIANALGNLGMVYQYLGNYKKAEELHLESLKYDSLQGNSYNMVSSYVSLAELFLYKKDFTKTEKYLLNAIDLGNKLNAIHYLDDAYKVYTDLDSLKGDFKSAYSHQKLFQYYNDLILKDERIKQMDKLETVFSTKEKEQQIKLLNANSELNQLKIKQQEKQLMIFIIASVLLVILLSALIIAFRKNRQKNQELAEKNSIINEALEEKDVLLKEIHHRVKNNLQVISSLLSIQSRYIKDEKALEAINESKERVNAISVLHQEIYKNEVLSAIDAGNYLSNLSKGIQQTFDPKQEVTLIVKGDSFLLDVDQLIPLGLIVNELLTNAYKYGCSSPAPQITLSFYKTGNQVSISVSDNGKGMMQAPEAKQDSLGFKLVNMFVQKLKGTIDYKNDQGLKISLTF